MEGYSYTYVNREHKRAGGVALYVDNRLKYQIVESMTTAIKDVCECVTVEIEMEKMKNILISCVYRDHDSSIGEFREAFEAMLPNTEHKIAFYCGDYNINFLNPKKLTDINEFIDGIYSKTFYPIITKPSRITTQSATLIDNILTNNLANNLEAGLLLNGISDHLPVFVIYGCDHEYKPVDNTNQMYRLRTDSTVTTLRNELLAQDWSHVYENTDVNLAYNSFLDTFLTLYDKHCPFQQIRKNKTKQPDNPWLTRGLLNACKKKNNLYKDYQT